MTKKLRDSLPTPVDIDPNSDGWYYVMGTDKKGKWQIHWSRFDEPVSLDDIEFEDEEKRLDDADRARDMNS